MSPERVISSDGDAEPYVIFEKFIRAHSPISEEAIDAYLNEARKLLEAGSTFFCRRNFYPTNGDVFDLYSKGKLIGFIAGDDDYSVDVFIDSEDGPQKIGETIESGSYAENMLEGIARLKSQLAE